MHLPPEGGTPSRLSPLQAAAPGCATVNTVPVLEIALAQGIGNKKVKVKVLARMKTMNHL
jgi:hypothetical protein